jgi:hypothetical protein
VAVARLVGGGGSFGGGGASGAGDARAPVANLFGGWFRLSRWFPQATMRRIRDAIAEGERGHAGELCLAVESRYCALGGA